MASNILTPPLPPPQSAIAITTTPSSSNPPTPLQHPTAATITTTQSSPTPPTIPRPSLKRSETGLSTSIISQQQQQQQQQPPDAPILKRSFTTASKKSATAGTTASKHKRHKRKSSVTPLPQRLKRFAEAHIPATYAPNHVAIKVIRRLALVAHAYNFFFITLAIPWTCRLAEKASLALAYSCDVLILIDILIQSLVQIEEDFGIIETDFKKLSYRYMIKQLGVLRFICALPWDFIPLSIALNSSSGFYICHDQSYIDANGQYFPRTLNLYTWWALVRLIKLVPMVSLLKAFFSFQFSNITVQMSALIKNLLTFILFSHLSACLFWTVSSSTDSPSSWVNLNRLVLDSSNNTVPFATQYLLSLMTAEKALVFNSRDPKTNAESLYSVIETLIAALIYGSIFGNIATIVKYMDQEQQAQDEEKHNRHRLENLKRYMNEKLIPAEIQDKVMLYQKHKFGRTMGIVNEENVFDGIPRVLKQDIANYLYFDLVSKLPFLQGADRPFLEAITLAVRPLSVLKGYYIFKKDDEGNEMFFILRGSVDIVNENGAVLANIKSGEFFDEVAVIDGCRRTASAKAYEDTDLCYLKKEDFDRLLGDTAHRALMEAANKIREAERLKRIQAEASGLSTDDADSDSKISYEQELMKNVRQDQKFMVDLLQQKTRKNSVNLAGLAASNSRSNLLSSNSLNASVGKNARRASISSISGGGTSGGSAFMLAVAAATASNAAAAAAASNLSRMSSYDSRASSQNSFNFGDLNSLSLNETNEIATKLKTNLLQLEESRLALMSQIEQVEKHALFLQKLTDSMHNKRDSLQIPNATPSKLAISKNTKSGNNGSDSNEGSSRDLLVAEPEEYKEKDQSTRSSRVESRGKMSSSEVLSFNPSLMAIQSTSAMQLPNNNVNDKGEMDVNDGSSSALPVVNKTSGFALVLPDYKVDTTAPTTGPTHLRESAVEIVISENLNGHNSK